MYFIGFFKTNPMVKKLFFKNLYFEKLYFIKKNIKKIQFSVYFRVGKK